MSHVKAGGTAKNLRDSNPKFLGTKLYAGQKAKVGSVIVRQRGTKIMAGENTGLGKDHTIFATKEGIVKFTETRKHKFDGSYKKLKKVSVVA